MWILKRKSYQSQTKALAKMITETAHHSMLFDEIVGRFGPRRQGDVAELHLFAVCAQIEAVAVQKHFG